MSRGIGAALTVALFAFGASNAHAKKKPKLPKWKKGERTTPRESEAIAQDLTGLAIEPEKLVSVKAFVAGADKIRHAKERDADERWLVSPELAAAIIQLRREVRKTFGTDYDLWLNGAYDSSGKAHKDGSFHSTARAVDLDLYRKKTRKHKAGKDDSKLGEFAVLVNQVFTSQTKDGVELHGWVLHEGNHVHASLESPSLAGGEREQPEDTQFFRRLKEKLW